MSHSTDLPRVTNGQILTAETLNALIDRANDDAWRDLLAEVRTDARRQVDTMAARWGL